MGVKAILMTALGVLLLALGIVGVFVPVLPTTPFVLAAAGCLGATPRFRRRIMRAPLLRDYFASYGHRKKLPTSTVVVSLALLWGVMAASIASVETLWVDCMLVIIGLAVTVHIVYMAIRTRAGRRGHARRESDD